VCVCVCSGSLHRKWDDDFKPFIPITPHSPTYHTHTHTHTQRTTPSRLSVKSSLNGFVSVCVCVCVYLILNTQFSQNFLFLQRSSFILFLLKTFILRVECHNALLGTERRVVVVDNEAVWPQRNDGGSRTENIVPSVCFAPCSVKQHLMSFHNLERDGRERGEERNEEGGRGREREGGREGEREEEKRGEERRGEERRERERNEE